MYRGMVRASRVAASGQERVENGCMEDGDGEEEEGERGMKALVLPVGEAEPPAKSKKKNTSRTCGELKNN